MRNLIIVSGFMLQLICNTANGIEVKGERLHFDTDFSSTASIPTATLSQSPEQADKKNNMSEALSHQMLTQADISKVKPEIPEFCEAFAFFEAKHALFNKNFTGQKYEYKIPAPKLKEFRIAIAGDSVTSGFAGTVMTKAVEFSDKYRSSDNDHGVQYGWVNSFTGLAYQLLKDNNKTMKYTFMNYAYESAQMIDAQTGYYRHAWPPPWVKEEGMELYQKWDYADKIKKFNAVYYPTSCRAQQLNNSLPHVVFMGFGACDTLRNEFTEDGFIQYYTDYIKKVQAMPSKPIVMLMVPVFTRLTRNSGEECVTNKNDPFMPSQSSCPHEAMIDLQYITYKIAKMNNIPDHHVINAWAVLRLNPKVAAKDFFIEDNAHPNERGMGAIAQELFMKMSLSPEIHARQELQAKGMDEDWNNAVRQLLEKEQQQQVQSTQKTN